jgi:hypothetical protein
LANCNENPFYGTAKLYPLMGSRKAMIDNGETGAALVARLGDLSQNVVNKYWRDVLSGAEFMKEQRAKAGKFNPTPVPGA